MLDVEDRPEIRRLHLAEGLSIKEIVRRTGVARNTVRSTLRSEAPPVFDRKPAMGGRRGGGRDPGVVGGVCGMPATVIAERTGWDRSLTILKDRVRKLRPLFLPPDPSQRTEYRPGELAQPFESSFPETNVRTYVRDKLVAHGRTQRT